MSGVHLTTKFAAVTQGLIAGFGLIGNALVIFVYLMGRDKQDTSSVTYILNLAVADFLYLLTVPFSISHEIHLYWIFGDVMCKITTLLLYLNFLVSPLFLMVMSIDRSVSVYRATSSHTMRSSRVARRISLGVWIVSFVIVTGPSMLSKTNQLSEKCEPVFPGKPLCDSELLYNCIGNDEGYSLPSGNLSALASIPGEFVTNGITDASDVESRHLTEGITANMTSYDITEECLSKVCPGYNRHACMSAGPISLRIWNYFNFALNYFFPCAVIIICYAALLYHVYHPNVVVTSSSSSAGGMKEIRRRRITIVVALLVLSYFICFTPYYIWLIVMNVGVQVSSQTICSHVRRFNITMADLNSALNPILYPFIGNQFHNKLKLALRRLRRKTRNSKFGSMHKMSLRQRRFDSNRNRTRRETLLESDVKKVDGQELIEKPVDYHENAGKHQNSGEQSNRSNNSGIVASSYKLSSTTSSGCLPCLKSDYYVCPECLLDSSDQENGKFNQSNMKDDVVELNVSEKLGEIPPQRRKLCKKHRSSEGLSSAVTSALFTRGRWRYASSVQNDTRFATEMSLVGENL